jgi:hypothetical protein
MLDGQDESSELAGFSRKFWVKFEEKLFSHRT